MTAAARNQLSETAYLVAESRARAVAVSRDVYAPHWIPDHLRKSVTRLWNEFAAEVYPHDDMVLAIRNRFFLERLEAFAAAGPAVFVNIAAGFTSYPFLMERPVPTIEIDLPAVLEAKSARMRELPDRPVRLIPADLNDPSDRQRLASLFASEFRGVRSFVLMEGITYYLQPAALDFLWTALARSQTSGSILALDYWPPELQHHAVFNRLRRFFSERFGFGMESYTLLDIDRIKRLEGYRVTEATDVSQQEGRFSPTNTLQDTTKILWEHYAVLTARDSPDLSGRESVFA